MTSWFDIPKPETTWLIDGLITSDGHASICGKPKAGKSTFVRNLIASVIKGQPFIGRATDLPEGTGRVLYIHLDRKDQPWRVANELRHLGITAEESPRLIFRTAQDIPGSFEERLKWLQQETSQHKPCLIVIDLLWQFVVANNSNDYNAVLNGINTLQDSLIKIGYKGALLVTLHGRKATNPNEPFDDVLGSTGQRGSFSTNIMLTRYRKEGVYTIMSDQTERDEVYGEIPETVLRRKTDGTLALNRPFNELVKAEKELKAEGSVRKLLAFIGEHPGCNMPEIMDGLNIAKKSALKFLGMAAGLWYTTGEGEKGDPHRYFLRSSDVDPQAAATEVIIHDWTH